MYVMNTKLTLRMDDELVRQAKAEAALRGKSVSQMVGEFVDSLSTARRDEELPPVTASLVGVLKGHDVSQADYKKHLLEKYL
jgi:hypothetical protein